MAKAVSFKLDADMKSMMQGFQQMLRGIEANNAKLVTLTRNIKNASNQLERTGDRGKSAFDKMGGSLTSIIGRFAGATVALNEFRNLLSDAQREAQQAATKLEAQFRTAAALAQVAQSPAEMRAALLRAKIAALKHGVPLSDTQSLTFAGISAGMTDLQSLDIAASTSRFGADPVQMMESVGMMRRTFGEGSGDIRQWISAFGAAAAPSNVRMDQLAQAAIRAAPGVRAIGGTEAELLGLTSVLSPQYATPEQAATGIDALAALLKKHGYADAGVVGGLQQFRTERPEEFQKAYLGEREAGKAIDVINNSLSLIAQRIGEVQYSGQTGSIYDKMLRMSNTPELNAVISARRAAIKSEIEHQTEGLHELEFEAAVGAQDARLKEAGAGPLYRAGARKLAEFNRWLTGPENAAKTTRVRWQGVSGPTDAVAVADAGVQELLGELQKITDAVSQTARNTTGGPELAPHGSVGAEMRPRE